MNLLEQHKRNMKNSLTPTEDGNKNYKELIKQRQEQNKNFNRRQEIEIDEEEAKKQIEKIIFDLLSNLGV